MTATAPRPAVSDMDEARLTRLLAQRKADAARLAETDAKLADLCRKWGYAHGYKVALGVEQVLRAIEAGKANG